VIKLLIYLVVAACLAYCGATVKLGKRTFFGHVAAIWRTEEVQDLKHGVQEKAGPAVERVKRGVQAGLSEDGSAAGSGAAGSGSAHAPAPREGDPRREETPALRTRAGVDRSASGPAK